MGIHILALMTLGRILTTESPQSVTIETRVTDRRAKGMALPEAETTYLGYAEAKVDSQQLLLKADSIFLVVNHYNDRL